MDQYIGRMLDNRYEILERIGTGGMAVVYKAKCHRLNRLVAVKILKSDLTGDADFRRRFHDESQAVAMLSHPNIVSVYDVSRGGDVEYIVMELIDGITLKQYMERRGQLNWREALHFMTQIMRGLSHAHSLGIVHRDIKPQNIMVLRDGSVKVADFGIACLANAGQTLTQEALGSVHYISPEQASGGKITACSDVYSLGIVLFEMLTGQVPYVGTTAVAVAMMHVEKPIPRLADYMENVPEGLQEIMDKALAKRCEDRYANAAQLRKDLLSLKMKLFPFSNEDYTQELGHMQSSMPLNEPDVEGATVIMQPVRSQQLTEAEMGATMPLPPVRKEESKPEAKESETAPQQEAVVEEKVGKQGDMKKKKLNFTKLIIYITICVVAISMVAHFLFNRNLAEIAVPDVKNMTVVEAQKLLEEKEFKVELEEKYGDPAQFKPGTVMEQSPKAGEKRKQRSLIILTICKGAELKAVPDIVGMSEGKAENTLLNAGFKIGKITKKHVEGQRIGTVLTQSPKALDKAPKGSGIDLVIKEGDKEVPNLIGKSIADAKRLLAQAGLTLGEVKEVNDHSAVKNVVLASNPNAGTKIGAGDPVSISVAAGSGQKKSAYVDFVVPGKKPVAVQLVLVDDNGKTNIYSGTQMGGVRLRQRVEFEGIARVLLYCYGKVASEKVL